MLINLFVCLSTNFKNYTKDDFDNDCLVNATSSSNNFDLSNDTGPLCNSLTLNNSNSDNAFGNDHLSVNAGSFFYSFFTKDTFKEDQFSGDTSPNSKVMTESVSTNSEDYKDLENQNNILELKIGLTFVSWVEFKAWLNSFAKNQGFSYRVRTSQIDGEMDEDNENVNVGLQEHEQDVQQVLFKLLVRNIAQEVVLKV
ncbi:4764_t:CDS:2 [Cetraspora pellucida]|uniref:4764_t:CDS:1 n=1 Tax=Cetraspora pellucida TaxID=1433469 RepID=A0A9N9F169_9GLOM|nr:4764_t:CDS:2 [Cetraspora pellucida]